MHMERSGKTQFSILVVDDNKENLKVVSSFLKKEGYRIALALNADDAMNILEENEIDLILLDVMMPGIDGFTLCRNLKKDEKLSDIPVVFLTAKTETSDLVEGFDAGGVDYITKPFQKEELVARVNNHIELTQARKKIMQQAEHIQKINRTKDRLYSVIAHDIRSPFSNISMLISTLADGYLEPGSEEYDEILQSINRSSQETYALLENLLQWTRSQTGNLEVLPEEFYLKEMMGNVIRVMEPVANKKNIQLYQDVNEQLTMKGDTNMIRSVFQNLLSNAIKFTHEGGKAGIQASSGKDNNIIVEVTDNGIGMSEEHLKKLFVDEGQLTTRGTGDEKGSGLGLLLVKDFVSRHKGTIEVDSKPEKGTTIRLIFPPV